MVQLRGKTAAARVYEVFDADDEPTFAAKLASFEGYFEGVAAWCTDDGRTGHVYFTAALARVPGGPLAQIYLTRPAAKLAGS